MPLGFGTLETVSIRSILDKPLQDLVLENEDYDGYTVSIRSILDKPLQEIRPYCHLLALYRFQSDLYWISRYRENAICVNNIATTVSIRSILDKPLQVRVLLKHL